MIKFRVNIKKKPGFIETVGFYYFQIEKIKRGDIICDVDGNRDSQFHVDQIRNNLILGHYISRLDGNYTNWEKGKAFYIVCSTIKN